MTSSTATSNVNLHLSPQWMRTGATALTSSNAVSSNTIALGSPSGDSGTSAGLMTPASTGMSPLVSLNVHTPSPYSSLLTPNSSKFNPTIPPNGDASIPNGSEYHDPFRYSRDHMLGIWRAGAVTNGGPGWKLAIEVERHEGVVIDTERIPSCARELTEAEAKLYSGASLNSRRPSLSHANSHVSRDGEPIGLGIIGRRGTGDGSSMANSSSGLRGGAFGSPSSPLRERFSRRESGGTTQPYRPRQLATGATAMTDGAPPLISPRANSGGFGFGGGPGFDGVLNAGEGWGGRKRGALGPTNRAASYLRDIQEKANVNEETQRPPDDSGNEHVAQHAFSADSSTDNPVGARVGGPSTNEEPAFENWEDDPEISLDDPKREEDTNYAGDPTANGIGHSNVVQTPPDTSEIKWQYIDDNQATQGPFAPGDLAQWYASGWLRPDLRMNRLEHDSMFLPLSEWKQKMIDQGITDESQLFLTWYEPVRSSPKPPSPVPLAPPPGLALPSHVRQSSNQSQGQYSGSPVVEKPDSESEMTKSDAPSVFDMLRKSDLAGKGSQTPSSLLSGSGDGVFANSPATSNRIPIRGGVLDPLINGSPASMRAEMFHAGSMDAVMGVNGSMGAGRLHYPASSASSSISALPQQGPVYLQNQPYGVPGGRPVAYFPQDVGRIGHGPIGGYANVSFPQPFVNDPAIAGYHGMGSPYTTPGFQRGPHDFHGPHRANTVSLGDPTNSTTSSVSNFQQGAFGGRRSPSPPQQAGLTGGLGGEVYEGAIGATTTNNAIGRMSGIPDIESVASPGGQPSTATLYTTPTNPIPQVTQAMSDVAKVDSKPPTVAVPNEVQQATPAVSSVPKHVAVEPSTKLVSEPAKTAQAEAANVPTEAVTKVEKASAAAALRKPANSASVNKTTSPVAKDATTAPSEPADATEKAPEVTLETNDQPFIVVKRKSSVASQTVQPSAPAAPVAAPAPVASTSAASAATKSPPKTTVSLASLITNTSPVTPTAPQPPKAWAKIAVKDETKSLKEIQEAEAKKAKDAQRSKPLGTHTAPPTTNAGKDEDIQGMSWGLPISMAGNRTASATKEASTTSSAATAPAPVWANAAKANVGVVKKAMTMKDIQEEEERKRKKEREVTTAAKRVAEKPTPPPVATAAAAGPGSAWSTVGSNGKSNRPSSASPSTTGSASGIAGLPPRPSAAAIAGSGMRAPHITSAVASMSATPAAGTAARRPTSAASSPAVSVAKSSTPQSASEDSSQTVSVETLKWMRDTLRGKLQKGITVDEVVGLVLNMHEEDDIADTIWQSSTTLPGKHFAAEFLERRNIDREAGNFASTSRPAPARGSGNTSSGPETSRLQPGSSQDAFGYKVVKKKGRTGKA